MEVLWRPHPWYTILPLTAILAFLLTLTGVWQLVFLAGIAGGFLLKDARQSLLLGLAAGGLAWGVPLAVASYLYPLGEAASLLVQILGLSGTELALPYLMTLLIGGLTTGLGAALGAYLSALLRVAREELEQMA